MEKKPSSTKTNNNSNNNFLSQIRPDENKITNHRFLALIRRLLVPVNSFDFEGCVIANKLDQMNYENSNNQNSNNNEPYHDRNNNHKKQAYSSRIVNNNPDTSSHRQQIDKDRQKIDLKKTLGAEYKTDKSQFDKFKNSVLPRLTSIEKLILKSLVNERLDVDTYYDITRKSILDKSVRRIINDRLVYWVGFWFGEFSKSNYKTFWPK